VTKRDDGPSGLLDTRTRQAASATMGGDAERVPTLTLLCHPQASRVGERALLVGLGAGESVGVSRASPKLDQPGGRSPQPLADPFLSRDPLVTLEEREGTLWLDRRPSSAAVRVDGEVLSGRRAVTRAELEAGLVLELADRCVLLLHACLAVHSKPAPSFGFVGESDAIRRLRRELARVAATDMRVLVRGETGTGKELAARAVHGASARAAGPYEAVNMGAIQPSLAASALFGHVRGAFSGAVADSVGHFAAADDGTLFLDEIGETEPAVQAMLLRTLETGELLRVGDRRARAIDVRLVSATDADLEAAVAAGRFREPLLHRIAELTLAVPPLRERRDDVGRLVVHFLRELLSPAEQARLLDGEIGDHPWLDAGVVAHLARARWPGNVRQLRNVVRQLAVHGREAPRIALDPALEGSLAEAPPAPSTMGAPEAIGAAPTRDGEGAKRARPLQLTDDEILGALAKTGWKRGPAADLLGIARSSLYALIASNPRISRATDLSAEEVNAALAKHGGDVTAAAVELRVSEQGLKLRLKALRDG
jgi:two-component system nitrogen regulation response regulator GlnG